ncbi:hypothetical protein E3V33_00090 [Candidatus Marinimicrobia bacterium MT.SAG.4]|nr:hypothetical protein E3V33_00090 [Candidatus Marinimicrobia bacterium MT.SAG.4]
MITLRGIFDRIAPGNDELSHESHSRVLHAVRRLSEIIPPQYRQYDLISIIMPKTYGYHTSFDGLYNDFRRLTTLSKKVFQNDVLSKKLAYQVLLRKKKEIISDLKYKKEEIKIFYAKNREQQELNFSENSYNIFFANMQTYLRVMVLYINQSKHNNNVLVVPRILESTHILKEVDKNKFLFFDDFITRDIHQKYINSKADFSEAIDSNIDVLQDIFNIEGINFFQFIQVGIENVFKYLLPQALLFYLTVEEILRNIPTNAVIGARVRRIYDRAFYTCTKHKQVDRFVLLHSNIGNDIRFTHGMGHFNDLTGVFTWGEKQKNIIEGDSFSNVKNIFVTGSPLFKSMNTNLSTTTKKMKSILYAGTNNDFKEVKLITQTINNLSESCKLVIKVHPGLDAEPYEKYSRTANVEIISGKEVLENYLKRADVLLTTISESSLQSILSSIPTLFLITNDRFRRPLFSLYDFNEQEEEMFIVSNKRQLIVKLNKLFSSTEYYDQFITHQSDFLRKTIKFHSAEHGATEEIDKILNS